MSSVYRVRGVEFHRGWHGPYPWPNPSERIHPSEHLIENHTEGEDVRSSVHYLAPDLLWDI